jgi:hypothetical protein
MKFGGRGTSVGGLGAENQAEFLRVVRKRSSTAARTRAAGEPRVRKLSRRGCRKRRGTRWNREVPRPSLTIRAPGLGW